MEANSQRQTFSLILEYLSRVYLEAPTEDFIDGLVSNELFSHWPLPVDEGTDIFRALQLLQSFCREWNAATLDDLVQDYTRLFIGLERTLAPPFESVYLSRDHIMFERQTLEVREFYKQVALEIPRLHKEPDDHIGYELHFVSLLCRREFESSDDILTSFLEHHLFKWVRMFCRRVWEQASSGYFKGNALLTVGTLELLGTWMNVAAKMQEDEYDFV